MMSLFKDMNNDIPIVNFNSVIRKTLMIYSTLPHSVEREFRKIDVQIEAKEIQDGYDYLLHPFNYELSVEEFLFLRRNDLKNLVFIDVSYFVMSVIRFRFIMTSRREQRSITASREQLSIM